MARSSAHKTNRHDKTRVPRRVAVSSTLAHDLERFAGLQLPDHVSRHVAGVLHTRRPIPHVRHPVFPELIQLLQHRELCA